MSDNKQNNKKTKTLETYFVRSADVEQQDKVEADDVKTTSKLISFYRAGKLVLLVQKLVEWRKKALKNKKSRFKKLILQMSSITSLQKELKRRQSKWKQIEQ
jgi:hypothetical protein